MNTAVVKDEDTASLHWARVHLSSHVSAFYGRHRRLAITLFALTVFLALFLREVWQPWVVFIRLYFAPVLLSLAVLYLGWRVARRWQGSETEKVWQTVLRWLKQGAVLVTAAGVVAGGVAAYEYFALYWRYQSFNVEVIDKMPETNHERIQPLAAVHGTAQGVMGDSRNPREPDLVWAKNKKTGAIEYRWTMGVEPKFWLDKVFGNVEEVIDISGTAATVSFPPENRREVNFAVGENLWLSSHAHTAAIRSFNPWMFLHYEPADVRYLEDDRHQLVEVISLLRWDGIFFPYPEFGGVLIVRQEQSLAEVGFARWAGRWLVRVFVGAGEWIPPEQVQNIPYLRGQNILPYRVSRYVAESLRFMNGILAPFPGYHQGDVRIPESGANTNPQPYTTPFKGVAGLPGMLHHYFSLEPYLAGKHGLVASVLIPADGTPRVLVYKHEERNESLIGASRVPALVMASRRHYNWDKSAPVEERPYVREGYFLWLTTVVTYSNAQKKEFIAGSTPEVALVDAVTQEVFWVDPHRQDTWLKGVVKQ